VKTVTVTKAKAELGKLIGETLSGKPVAIIRKNRLVALCPVEIGAALPPAPQGHVAHIYSPENLAAVGSHEERIRRLEARSKEKAQKPSK
jgi:hypothetical protein